MSARTRGGKVNTSTVLCVRKQACPARTRSESGSIPRQKKRSEGEYGRQKTSVPMTLCRMPPICVPKKII